MILKSMSRKEPSFGQLATYMSDEKSDRDFDVHHNLFSRNPDAIAEEFDSNAKHLGRRRGGNYLYHEILSIDTRACGQSREVREKLRLLALEFIQKRCPNNIVYGALHRDHAEHLHYHLMISANGRGEKKRLRLTKAAFDLAKRDIELSARTNYPELKQDEILASSSKEKQERREIRQSRNAQEMEKRGARLTKTEALAQQLRAILAYAASQIELERLLKEQGFTFYQRGKHCGVRPIPSEADTKQRKAYRFATLGIEDDYTAFLQRVAVVDEGLGAQKIGEGEKEKSHGQTREAEALTEGDVEPQKKSEAQQEGDAFLAEMEDRRAKRRAADDEKRSQTRGPQSRKR
jgi:hypothetical protein